MQCIKYLDQCELTDSKTLSYFHVCPEAKLNVQLWEEWVPLIIAASYGDIIGRFKIYILFRFFLMKAPFVGGMDQIFPL